MGRAMQHPGHHHVHAAPPKAAFSLAANPLPYAWCQALNRACSRNVAGHMPRCTCKAAGWRERQGAQNSESALRN